VDADLSTVYYGLWPIAARLRDPISVRVTPGDVTLFSRGRLRTSSPSSASGAGRGRAWTSCSPTAGVHRPSKVHGLALPGRRAFIPPPGAAREDLLVRADAYPDTVPTGRPDEPQQILRPPQTNAGERGSSPSTLGPGVTRIEGASSSLTAPWSGEMRYSVYIHHFRSSSSAS